MLAFLLALFLCVDLSAQVEINGSLDFEVSYGGKHSSFVTNEIPNEFRRPHLSIAQANLFLFAPVSDAFSFNARLQMDTWGSGRLSNPKLTLAMLTWESPNSAWLISVGRFVRPFGLYPRRHLAADNLFTHAPLAYGYFVNVSDERGFWPLSGDTGIYLQDDVGQTTVYFGGYDTGILISWIIIPQRLNIDVAATNAALSSRADYTNLNNAGGIVRVGIQPVIFWQQGFSAAYGSFMQRTEENGRYANLERFRQLVFGADLILAYLYFELSGEFIYSRWRAPGFANDAFKEIASGDLGEFNLENYSAYADLKVEPPFLTGSYIAFRYDIIRFLEYDHPNTIATIGLNPWDNDVDRYSVAVGYKFARPVLLKICYSDQKLIGAADDPEDFSIRGILTVSF